MKITYLADHQDVIPLLSKWFHREWAYLYPERTEDGVTRLISERTNRDKIPIALVAFDGKKLIGTVCLKSNDMDTKPELNPWLAGLYVKESYRKNGVGSCLVKAIEQKAFEMGISRLFLYTPESEVFYSKLGWNIKEREDYRNVSVSVMEKENVL